MDTSPHLFGNGSEIFTFRSVGNLLLGDGELAVEIDGSHLALVLLQIHDDHVSGTVAGYEDGLSGLAAKI
jgi:hypothetical protein